MLLRMEIVAQVLDWKIITSVSSLVLLFVPCVGGDRLQRHS